MQGCNSALPQHGDLYKVRKAESRDVSLQALFDLEATNQELKSDLRDLYITGAREVDVNASRKAIIIHVSPYADDSTL